ncbi:MAG: DUF3566 domain-containing protein [Mycobacteriales bacterium]
MSDEPSDRPPEAGTALHGEPEAWPTREFPGWLPNPTGGPQTTAESPQASADAGADPPTGVIPPEGIARRPPPGAALPPHLRPDREPSVGWAPSVPRRASTQARAGGGAGPVTGPRPGPRRARLTLKRVDPWSVLKVTFVYSLAAFVIFLVAVGLLYGILSALGVFHSLDTFLSTVGAGSKAIRYIAFSRILLYAAIIGVINVVLFSALATIGAFLYNICGELVGGFELTLTETQ